ncbi:MAG: sulfotransferase [Pseudomonadales bacterium]|nr:sulfotransferase [Pseudomonadales bacterium]
MKDSLAHLYESRRYAECKAACLDWLADQPSNLSARKLLIRSLTALGHLDESLMQCDQSLLYCDTASEEAEILFFKGEIYSNSQQDELALQSFTTALQKDDTKVSTAFMLAYTTYRLNRFDESRSFCMSLLERGTSVPPALYGHTIYLLAQMDRSMVFDDLRQYLLKVSPDLPVPFFHYGVAELLDRQEEYLSAFQHYEAANALIRKDRPYPFGGDLNALKQYQAMFSGDFFSRLEPLARDSREPIPIFIVGMPRSGSSLLEQMLGEHSEITPQGEVTWLRDAFEKYRNELSNPKDPNFIVDACLDHEFRARLRDYYLTQMDDVQTSYFTDKLPGNHAYGFLIHSLFPDALVIHLKRDRIATLWSCFKTPFTVGHRYSESLVECYQYIAAVERMMAHWKSMFSDRIFTLDYETLIDEPEASLSEVFSKLNLDLEPSCLEPHKSQRIVNTASRNQVIQPLYASANKQVAPYIGYIEDRLGEGLKPEVSR